MFIKDINIFWYVGIGILGLFVGGFVDLMNKNMPEHKKIFSVEAIKNYFNISKINYVLSLIMCAIYVIILLTVGVNDWLKLVEYLVIAPMLVSAFYIDCKHEIIPNRLTLTMWEFGALSSIVRGVFNLNVAIEMWIGILVGSGIFLIITFLGNIIFRKETMGLGDVKIMGAIRFIFRVEKCNSSNCNFILFSCNL